MIYISIVFTLFSLMAGMLLLAKTRKESLGKLYSSISYLVIIISLLILTCQAARGIMQMACRNECSPPEHCMMMSGMMNGGCDRGGCMMMRHGWMKGGGHCEEEMEMHKSMSDSTMGGKKHCCDMDMEEKGDSTAGK